MRYGGIAAAVVLVLVLGGCERAAREPARAPAPAAGETPDARGQTPPSAATAAANQAVAEALPLADRQDFDDAVHGLVASDPDVVIEDASGRRIWDTTSYGFVAGEAPASVNPSLWRQARLNGVHGLFQVADGIYQVRGYDLSNMTIITGRDALTRFGDAEVVFASHHWPVWGTARVRTYLGQQRDVHRDIHDQTVRMANAGLGPREIAERLELPESLRPVFATRGYYGTVKHNAKAVYQA
jgi:alkyl sulfatase BDS1-like metallo-beta-lactamase superfamily hydrolase